MSWLPHEGALKTSLLLVAFVSIALWETFRPRQRLLLSTPRRWLNHALLWTASNFAAGWIFRASAVAVALAAGASRYGLLNRESVPYWMRFAAAVLLLDLARYGQHRLYHAVPWLWRLHQLHHADRDYDWSTGLRFHPAEVLLTQGSYLLVIAALAPPPLAVLFAELVDLAVNLFVHANVALPGSLDARMRRLVVTPDLHRIHHSGEVSEQNTNFGVVFPWWDHLFGTYVAQPAAGQDKLVTGLAALSGESDLSLFRMLTLPFRRV